MPAAGSHRDIASRVASGLCRLPGAVRTSTSRRTPALRSSRVIASASAVPWPKVSRLITVQYQPDAAAGDAYWNRECGGVDRGGGARAAPHPSQRLPDRIGGRDGVTTVTLVLNLRASESNGRSDAARPASRAGIGPLAR